jgi:DNA-binding response OmpR family regulator
MKGLRILVVEDDAIIGALLAEMLVGMGHEPCSIVATEADAVRAADQYQPDLMIVDARLGEGSGDSAVEKILRKGPMPHLFISGGDISRLQALRPGAVAIQKPFRESALHSAIRRALVVPGS